MWGRTLNIPYHEYEVMPLGELNDIISAYQICNGFAEEKKKTEDKYIPALK